MSATFPQPLRDLLIDHGQGHLLEHAQRLTGNQLARFVHDVGSVDWPLVARLTEAARSKSTDDSTDIREMAHRATSPSPLVRRPATPQETAEWERARQRGEDWLRAGKVGVVVVAGGQGTRLGFDAPKGTFPIGPVSGKSLFQWFFEQLRARRQRSGQPIPYAIMTSAATHEATVEYLRENQAFGFPRDSLLLFQQGHLPAIDVESGRALLNGPGELALSPNGHGGMLSALASAHILAGWKTAGIETLFYHQIDNPSTPVCDPAMIGWHLEHAADVSTLAVAKRTADEKMGVIVAVDGATRILEYTDLPDDVARQTDHRGRLKLWAGNTAMHVFQREFLERAVNDDAALPFHSPRKFVPYWREADGTRVVPQQPNAFKFERFIFDVLPWANRSLVIEGSREDMFNPVKNAEGSDSPATSREALMNQHRRWLRKAGVDVADDVPVELSPLLALCSDDLVGRVPPGQSIHQAAYLNESWLHELRRKLES